MLNEIFIPLTCAIVSDVLPIYSISNYGKIYNNKTKKFIGNFSNKNGYRCTLKLLDGKRDFKIDILEYCAFNNKNYDGSIKIKYKDGNIHNLYIENLLNTIDITDNSIISSSDYYIKHEKIMCYYTNEIWMNITDREVPNVLPIYMISNHGRVYNKLYGSILYNYKYNNGYLYTIIKSKNKHDIAILIHRIMMKCFYPIQNCNNFEVNHIDANSFNNELYNLEWVTPEENERLMIGNNKKIKKFTESQVRDICLALKNNLNFAEIAFYVLSMQYTGSLHSRLCDIKLRKTYTSISKYYIF